MNNLMPVERLAELLRQRRTRGRRSPQSR
jgi:hypothetical protein